MVWSLPVWGGGWHWYVKDRETRRFVSRGYLTEAAAVKRCDKMNADWQEYLDRDIPACRHPV